MKVFFSPIREMFNLSKFIGPRLEKLIGGKRLIDLLLHMPIAYDHYKGVEDITSVKSGDFIVINVRIRQHFYFKPHKVLAYDILGNKINIVFFNLHHRIITQSLKIGGFVCISGVLTDYNGDKTIVNPKLFGDVSNFQKWTGMRPLYPLKSGISNLFLCKIIQSGIAKIPTENSEWLPDDIIKKYNWQSFCDCIRQIHMPKNENDLEKIEECKNRIAFDEILSFQINLLKVKKKNQDFIKIDTDIKIIEKIKSKIPFKLTDDQNKVIFEIINDISRKRMLRLLQGDVGSGKTIIAIIFAIYFGIKKMQFAIMVPLSILAKQHFENFSKLASEFDLKTALLTSDIKGKQKKEYLKGIKNGEIDIIIGTHALINDWVLFKNLAFMVIDEQHRFGVKQRINLANKGKNAHTLIMTATPIPRTLMMTTCIDLDISQIKLKPPNVGKRTTICISKQNIDKIYSRIQKWFDLDNKIFWVCPLIEISEKLEFQSCVDRFNELGNKFKGKVTMIHGKMKEIDKENSINDFTNGKAKIMVSTSVIEVGVNITSATIMIIEDAEKFGLAQLHQLRGRVGRGEKDAICILLHGKLSEHSRSRLDIMRQSDDGFLIAEKDLQLRGAGEILGEKQSGDNNFKIAIIENMPENVLSVASKYANQICNSNDNYGDDLIPNIFNSDQVNIISG